MRCALVLLLFAANLAEAQEYRRISPDEGMSRVSFKHLQFNDAGDFVAASNTKIFAGNLEEGSFRELVAEQNISFVLYDYVTRTIGDQSVSVDFELMHSRAALNAHGDFVVVSNRTVWAGNARTGNVRQIGEAPQFTSFQKVVLNDAGHFLVSSYTNLWAGSVVEGTFAKLVEAERGNFGIYDLYDLSNRFTVATSYELIALNEAGQFVAASSRSVYVGSIPEMQARLAGSAANSFFRHVRIDAAGRYLLMNQNEVFAGDVAP